MALPTITDIAKAASVEVADVFVDCLGIAGIVDALPVETIPGRAQIVPVISAGAEAGFRDANGGVSPSIGTIENKTIETGVLSLPMEVDSAVIAGAGLNKDLELSKAAEAAVKAYKLSLEKELVYSAAGDKGFDGLVDFVGATYSAGGTTVAGQTSAWIIYIGSNGARLVLGDNGRFTAPSWQPDQRVTDATGKVYHAYTSYIETCPGFKIGHAKSIVRIANIDSTTNGKLTDAKLIEALALMPSELRVKPADVIIAMNPRARFQLQASRTATSATGAPAPMPTDVNGIRIVETDSIVDTEAVYAAPSSSSSSSTGG